MGYCIHVCYHVRYAIGVEYKRFTSDSSYVDLGILEILIGTLTNGFSVKNNCFARFETIIIPYYTVNYLIIKKIINSRYGDIGTYA